MDSYQIYYLPAFLRSRWEDRSEVVLELHILCAQYEILDPSEVRWATGDSYMLGPIHSVLLMLQSQCLTLKYRNSPAPGQVQQQAAMSVHLQYSCWSQSRMWNSIEDYTSSTLEYVQFGKPGIVSSHVAIRAWVVDV